MKSIDSLIEQSSAAWDAPDCGLTIESVELIDRLDESIATMPAKTAREALAKAALLKSYLENLADDGGVLGRRALAIAESLLPFLEQLAGARMKDLELWGSRDGRG
ncbi:MAG: hypothetical protein ACREDZ_14100 [Kiloniellales bacterium]